MPQFQRMPYPNCLEPAAQESAISTGTSSLHPACGSTALRDRASRQAPPAHFDDLVFLGASLSPIRWRLP